MMPRPELLTNWKMFVVSICEETSVVQDVMFRYVSLEQRVPSYHPLREVRKVTDVVAAHAEAGIGCAVRRVLLKIQRLLDQPEDIHHIVVTSETFRVGPVSGEGPCTQGDCKH
jgi:hypothetical protein